MAGAVHVTRRLVTAVATTVGTAGFAGGSSSSCTVTTTVRDVVLCRSPLPLVALTSSTYSLSPAAFAGVVLSASSGTSWFGAALNASAPVISSSSNSPWSTPPLSVYPVTLSSASLSLACTVPTSVWFSATSNSQPTPA